MGFHGTRAGVQIVHRPTDHRFETVIEGHRALLYYEQPRPDTIDLLTTFVPPALRGRGVGRALVLAAQQHARQQGWRIATTCWYARGILEEDGADETD